MKKSMKSVMGVAMVAAFVAASVQAGIVYVDLDTSNAEEWNGATYGAFTTSGALGDQGPANDGKWDVRAFENGGTIYQSAGTGGAPDDAARLKMTVSGLASGTYNVFAYFWSDTSLTWALEASLTDNVGGSLPLYNPSNADVQWYTGSDATILSDNAAVNGGVNPFTTAVIVGDGNRRLYQINLGPVTGTGFSVYLDDMTGMTDQSQRTWLDGVGYEAIPEPATFGLVGIFGAGVLFIRRRCRN